MRPGSAQQVELHTLNIRNVQDLRAYFRYTPDRVPLISAHRGGARKGFPENCLATLEHTLRHTPATFEVDPRLTKDSVIILMHDATLDRTTSGTGKVSDYTWDELKKLKLRDPYGHITEYGIPTLEEAIEWSRGKTVLILDKKDVPFEMTAEIIREHAAEHHVMITVHNAEEARFYYENNPDVMFEAFVKTPEAMEEYEKAGIPWEQVMAYVGPRVEPQTREMYELLHERGVMCMISSAPVYDKQYIEGNTNIYTEIIKSGADIIEPDLAVEAAGRIRPLIPEQSSKLKFFSKNAFRQQ